jgi:hypothetical protein
MYRLSHLCVSLLTFAMLAIALGTGTAFAARVGSVSLSASTGLSLALSRPHITPLPNCSVILVRHFTKSASKQQKRCLVHRTGMASPNTTSASSCSVDYYQNGPYGSSAWANGWGICVVGSGSFLVPSAYNDQASSWDSCSGGTFFVNQPFTTPYANFPSNSYGNFPWGSGSLVVPNDSLSSLWVASSC